MVRLDRLRDVAELALVDRADLVVDALLLVGVGDEIGLLLVDGEQVVPAREPEVELDQRVERAQVVLVDLEDLLVDGDRRFGLLEDVFLDRGGLEERVLLVVEARRGCRPCAGGSARARRSARSGGRGARATRPPRGSSASISSTLR